MSAFRMGFPAGWYCLPFCYALVLSARGQYGTRSGERTLDSATPVYRFSAVLFVLYSEDEADLGLCPN